MFLVYPQAFALFKIIKYRITAVDNGDSSSGNYSCCSSKSINQEQIDRSRQQKKKEIIWWRQYFDFFHQSINQPKDQHINETFLICKF